MKAAWLVLVLLAGCSSVTPPAQVQTCQEEACQTVIVEDTPEPLRIEGVVVDETITPVAKATVRLFQAGEKLGQVTTGANGAFSFLGLEEGFYRLVAGGQDHSRTETQVDLKPGLDMIRIQVVAQPPIVPIHKLVEWDGFVSCSTYTFLVYVSGDCGILQQVTGARDADRARDFWDEIMEADMHPDWVQSELYWESQQVMGDGLWLDTYRSSPDEWRGERLGWYEGRSPLVFSMDAQAIHDHGIGRATNVSMPHGVAHHIWAGAPDPLTPSIVIEQPFTLYFSLVYHMTPPEGWMFVTDGSLT